MGGRNDSECLQCSGNRAHGLMSALLSSPDRQVLLDNKK